MTFIYVFVNSRSPVVLKLKESAVKMIVMVQCFAPDCNHPSESDTYRSLVSIAGKKADEYQVDSSIEVTKDFVVIYFFKLKNAVRPKVRYVCTMDRSTAVAMLLALHVFVTFKSVFLSVLFGYYWFSYFDFKSPFLLSE